MTTVDKDTGLPVLGGAANDKKVPIDPRVLTDLKDAEKAVQEARQVAQAVGYQLVLLFGNAAIVGPKALEAEKAYRDIVSKIAALHGVAIPAIKDIDTEKGQIILK